MDQYTLATAGPRYRDPYTNRPIVGVVNINTKVNTISVIRAPTKLTPVADCKP